MADTIPAAFWVTYHISSSETVIGACRSEVNKTIIKKSKTITNNLNVMLISCPLLLFTYHEVFRDYRLANSVRIVSEDHLLGGQYLLNGGGFLIMSARAQHSNHLNGATM